MSLRSFNNFLTFIVILLGLYIAVTPYLPNLDLWINKLGDSTNGIRYSGILAEQASVSGSNLAPPPGDNRLIIPTLHIDEPIILSSNPEAIDIGVWQRPRTSTPNKGGNTVLVGHRFSYNAPSVFYHLDKIKSGDIFAVWWEGQEYVYEVFNTRVVAATAIEIEANTEQPIMTLYTCTPIWTAKDRLVIQARLLNTDVLTQNPTIGAR